MEQTKPTKKEGVTVAGKSNCLIIAPDGYTETFASSYTAEAWASEEAAGLVCLPTAGFRGGSNVEGGGIIGRYRSSTPRTEYAYSAYCLFFDSDNVDPVNYSNRDYGFSLRLVKTVE